MIWPRDDGKIEQGPLPASVPKFVSHKVVICQCAICSDETFEREHGRPPTQERKKLRSSGQVEIARRAHEKLQRDKRAARAMFYGKRYNTSDVTARWTKTRWIGIKTDLVQYACVGCEGTLTSPREPLTEREDPLTCGTCHSTLEEFEAGKLDA